MADRRDTRVTAGVGVLLHIGGQTFPCLTRNISRGGMFAVTRAEVAEGEIITVELVPKTGARMRARARVAQRTAGGLGLSFVDPDEQFGRAVRALMDELVASQGSSALAEYDDVDDDVDVDIVVDADDSVKLSWAYPGEEGARWKFWQKRRQAVRILNLTLDGAGLQSDYPPEIGETVVVYIEGRKDRAGKPLATDAEVVRHTEGGFAVKFSSPSVAFRRAVSAARRSKFEGG